MTTALWNTPTQEAEARRVVSSKPPQVHKKHLSQNQQADQQQKCGGKPNKQKYCNLN